MRASGDFWGAKIALRWADVLACLALPASAAITRPYASQLVIFLVDEQPL